MANLDFWVAAIGIPLLAFSVNVIIRRMFSLPQSAFADLVLVMVVFDALVIVQHDDFCKFIRVDFVQKSIVGSYLMLLIIDLVVWFVAVTRLETKMATLEGSNTISSNVDWLFWQFVSGVLALAVVISSVAPFAYKGGPLW